MGNGYLNLDGLFMGYQPKGPAVDPADLKPPPSGTGVTMYCGPAPHKPDRMCVDCALYAYPIQCGYRHVHPLAKACPKFDAGAVKITPPAHGTITVTARTFAEACTKLPATKLPSAGMKVMK